MALLGKMDQILAPKGVSMTIAPLGAVCAVLLATPSSPGARVSLRLDVFLVSFFRLDSDREMDKERLSCNNTV